MKPPTRARRADPRSCTRSRTGRTLAALFTLGALLAPLAANAGTDGYAGTDSAYYNPRVIDDRGVDAGHARSVGVQVSRERFPASGSATAAVLSRWDNHVDAQAGAVLTYDKPLLFTETDQLSADTEIELRRVLAPRATVYLLGGTGALSTAVEQRVRYDGYRVVRLSGTDRWATGAAIAEHALTERRRTTFLLTRGDGSTSSSGSWADTISAGALAAERGYPVVHTTRDVLPGPTLDVLRAHADTVIIVGGTGAISSGVEQQLRSHGMSVRRVSGTDRAGTAYALARDEWGVDGWGYQRFVIAPGWHRLGWAWGFAGAGLAAERDAPMLLVSGSVPDGTRWLVDRCGAAQVNTMLLGGYETISNAVSAELAALDGFGCYGATSKCPAVTFVGARGSGQNAEPSFRVGLGDKGWEVLQEIRRRTGLPQSQLVPAGVNHPSTDVLKATHYGDSKRQGVVWTQEYVRRVASKCPGTSVALFGYSQGADVIGSAFQGAEGYGSLVSMVTSVDLLADAYKNHREPASVFPFYAAEQNSQGIKGARPRFTVAERTKVRSWCHPEDDVCNDHAGNWVGFHGSWYDCWVDHIARQIVLDLDAAGTTTATDTDPATCDPTRGDPYRG